MKDTEKLQGLLSQICSYINKHVYNLTILQNLSTVQTHVQYKLHPQISSTIFRKKIKSRKNHSEINIACLQLFVINLPKSNA